MAKDLLKLPNNKRGFLILLIIEAVIAVWSLAAVFYAVRAGRTRTAVYGVIVVAAVFYILGRSFRSYRSIARKEKAAKAKGEKSK